MSKLLSETPEIHSAEKSTSVPKGTQTHPWTGTFRLTCSKPHKADFDPSPNNKQNQQGSCMVASLLLGEVLGKERQIHQNPKPWRRPALQAGGTAGSHLSLTVGNKIHGPGFVTGTESTGCQQAELVWYNKRGKQTFDSHIFCSHRELLVVWYVLCLPLTC